MNKISFGLNSFGTIYGTCNDYDTQGVLIGAKNITGYGVFFIVRTSFGYPPAQILFQKSVGTGITITSAANGQFSVTVQSTDVNRQPQQYAYECFLNPIGTAYSATSELKGIGSGLFEITKGVRYGTA